MPVCITIFINFIHHFQPIFFCYYILQSIVRIWSFFTTIKIVAQFTMLLSYKSSCNTGFCHFIFYFKIKPKPLANLPLSRIAEHQMSQIKLDGPTIFKKLLMCQDENKHEDESFEVQTLYSSAHRTIVHNMLLILDSSSLVL